MLLYRNTNDDKDWIKKNSSPAFSAQQLMRRVWPLAGVLPQSVVRFEVRGQSEPKPRSNFTESMY